MKYNEKNLSSENTNIGILHKGIPYLDERALLCLCYSCIHSHLNYENTAWCSTNRTYLKKFQSQQKHTLRIIFHENKFVHIREPFKENNILNIYQLSILNNLFFHIESKTERRQCLSISLNF